MSIVWISRCNGIQLSNEKTVETEFEKYRVIQDRLFMSDYDKCQKKSDFVPDYMMLPLLVSVSIILQ
jgi:hypothetical protein